MKKIISLFQRNYHGDRLVRDELVDGAQWVTAGEGRPTRKYDGTCCMVQDGRLYKRYDAKKGAKKGKTPPGFIPAQPEPDPVTGHWPGWVPVGDGPEDAYHREGLANSIEDRKLVEWNPSLDRLPDGTYELCGPKIQKNPHAFPSHVLVPHGITEFDIVPVDFRGLGIFLSFYPYEGIVWHHPDGRMVKAKRKDFGHPWPPKE